MKQSNTDTVVLLSGGIDSSTALYWCLERGFNPTALNVHYGQRHAKERDSARQIAESAGVSLVEWEIALPEECRVGSLVGNEPIPRGHYEDPSMRITVVPARNLLLLSAAGMLAASIGAQRIVYGAHSGDHAIYPDCRPEFAGHMRRALQTCHYHEIDLVAPFMDEDKGSIVKRALLLGVPLALTWTCYEGSEKPCGQCGSCIERAAAYASAGVADPIAR